MLRSEGWNRTMEHALEPLILKQGKGLRNHALSSYWVDNAPLDTK